MEAVDLSHYEHSPVHKAVILKDHEGLKKIISELPRFCDPSKVQTESDSLAEDAKADAIAAVLDRRDVPNRDTPLHLAVKFSDQLAVQMLLLAGADYSLQNEKGWNPFEEALSNGEDHVARDMLRHYEPLKWAKWRRRLPRLMGTMRRMRDFYMEIKFHFESSAVPFISRIFPSDTYKIWKMGANLRADLTWDGDFEGFKVQRSSRSFRFLGDGAEDGKIPPGLLCIVSHEDKKITYGLEGSANPTNEADLHHEICKTTEVITARMSFNQAVLLPQMTWRRQEKTEMVGRWKAKVYDMHNVAVSFKTRKVPGAVTLDYDSKTDLSDVLTNEERKQLDTVLKMDSNDDDIIDQSETKREKKGWLSGWRRNSKKRSEKKTDPPTLPLSDNKTDPPTLPLSDNPVDSYPMSPPCTRYRAADRYPIEVDVKLDKDKSERDIIQDKEFKKNLRPTLWLSSDFPLRIEEFLPLLDILENRVTAIRRLREYLTTKLPQGTFPVKVSIPVVPTIRVIVTFTKFEELKPSDEDLSTSYSSPAAAGTQSSSSSWFHRTKSLSTQRPENIRDPFAFPSDYTWLRQISKKWKKEETPYVESIDRS
ncbi:Ankyrin repeat protein [Handroanthus impetiginosus]|uniref:Ankyrin repeat protein n=1 Tax=Handroanthus impetiginosus TaxID=429701 RepID=A0A2G9H5H1_9LAMI|nr:Ankyrin repeat protein [Handroanthus impetiginosus]